MPELPEAESIANALRRAITGRTIKAIEIFFPRLRTPLTPLAGAMLEGRKFTGVRRRARYAVCDLDDGRSIVMHFGMSGVVRVEKESPRRKHEHLFIHLDDGKTIKFEDPRRFGMVEVQEAGADGWPKGLAGIGVEPLSRQFTGKMLHSHALRRHGPVKNFLMDNSVVTGIGNIYVAEILFSTGISPLRPANRLSAEESEAIVKSAKAILKQAIRMSGTTISDYRNVDGSEGKFAQRLKIYGKAGRPCPRCGTTLQCTMLGGRSSVYCPHCQI